MKSLAPDLPPNGYGGWLAVLGTFQLLVLPILAVIELMATAASVDVGLDDPTPAASLIWLVQAVGQMIVVALGIYVAIQLRDVHPRAPEMNGNVLAAAFVWSAICGVLPFAADIPDDRRDAMVIPSMVNFWVIVGYVVIWSFYLRSSKRMKATYGEFYAKLQRPLSIAQPPEGQNGRESTGPSKASRNCRTSHGGSCYQPGCVFAISSIAVGKPGSD